MVTYSYVILHVSQTAFDEIKKKIETAGQYDHIFHSHKDGVVIDMHGIAIQAIGPVPLYNISPSQAQGMFEALEWFCSRVEKGEVRSKNSYKKFKEIIQEIVEEANKSIEYDETVRGVKTGIHVKIRSVKIPNRLERAVEILQEGGFTLIEVVEMAKKVGI